MNTPPLKLVASKESSAKQRALQALWDAITTPGTTVDEGNARMQAWIEACRRPQLGLAHEAPAEPDMADIPDDEEMQAILAAGEALLGQPPEPPPKAPHLTRVK